MYLFITGARNNGPDLLGMCVEDPSNISLHNSMICSYTSKEENKFIIIITNPGKSGNNNQATDNSDQSTVQPVDNKLEKGQSSNRESSKNECINEPIEITKPVISGDLELNRDKNSNIGNVNKGEKDFGRMKELQDTHDKLVDELSNVKNNLGQANKDLKQYGGVLREVDKAIDLNKVLPSNAKDKNRYCNELEEKFSEITSPQNSRRKNLEEILDYAKDEINSAEIWKAELKDKKTRLSEKLSSIETELNKLRKDSNNNEYSNQERGDSAQAEDSEKNISAALQKSLADRTVHEAALIEKKGLLGRIYQEKINPYKKKKKEEAIKEEPEENSAKVIDTEKSSKTDNVNVGPESQTSTEGSNTGSAALIAGVSAIGEAIATAIQNIL
jgi:hypothetical protein